MRVGERGFRFEQTTHLSPALSSLGTCLAPEPSQGQGRGIYPAGTPALPIRVGEFQDTLRYPSFLRTEVRAPFARSATSLTVTAMNRWAVFDRPCGTWNHERLNGYQGVAVGWNEGGALPLGNATIAALDAESAEVLGNSKALL